MLVDGETVLWDSCAICLYLLDQFDTDNILAPTEPAFRAKLYKVHLFIYVEDCLLEFVLLVDVLLVGHGGQPDGAVLHGAVAV